MTASTGPFLSGTIEGFYGEPWSIGERLELFDWMAAWGLNTYLYAPKDDLHHRALWREPYDSAEAATLAQVSAACRDRHVRLVYAVSPGLDIRYGDTSEMEGLRARFAQMLAMGCEDFAVLFDDIPDRFDPGPSGPDSLAAAQCAVASELFEWLRSRVPHGRLLFCPTAYCGRMVDQHVGGHGYLPRIGRELPAEIDVLWTGPNIVSREITVAHAQEVGSILRRRPVIWDNLHANDYDAHRFFCGPYCGRPPELREAVAGILSNPNNEQPLDYIPLRTLAAFCVAESPWDPRAAYLSAMREWLPSFETVRGAITFEDLVLFGDCFYLPNQRGPEAQELTPEKAARLREFCDRVTEIRRRPLFHALWRRLWDLRKELDALERRP